MAIITISEASKLVGKTTRTIQRHVANGKISKTTTSNGYTGIDTSELIRVYGQIKSYDSDAKKSHNVTNKKDTITNDDLQLLKQEIALLKVELEAERKRVEDKQETIDTLKSALKLLEHKQTKDNTDTKIMPDKEPEQTLSSLIEGPLIDTMEPVKSSTGFWSGFRKLFK